MSVSVLHIFQDEDSKNDTINSFVIDEALFECTSEEREQLWAEFTKMGTEADSSLLQAIWPHIALPGRGYGSLLSRYIIFKRLQERIKADSVSRIVVHSADSIFRPVIADVVRAVDDDIELEELDKSGEPAGGFGKKELLTIFKSFIDQIISMVLAPFYRQQVDSSTLVMPYPNRYQSTIPVIKELDVRATVVPTQLTLRWLLTERHSYSVEHSVRPIHTYASPAALGDQVLEVFSLLSQYRAGEWEIEGEINSCLNDMGADMPITVHAVCDKVIPSDLRDILTRHVFRSMVDDTTAESFVVGGMNARERFALATADQSELQLFYIPHSITTGAEVMPAQQETVQFIPGEFEHRYLKNSDLREYLPELVPMGRPYFDELNEQFSSVKRTDSDGLTALIPTQPYDDNIRKEYITSVISALVESNNISEYHIKIHPSESRSYYESVLEEHGHSDVKVKTGDIKKHFTNSDVTITISSNVGIESVFAGNACIAFNPWEPVVPTSPFLETESFPLFTDGEELTSFIQQFNVGCAHEWLEKQQRFVSNGYEINDSASKIAERIDTSSDYSYTTKQK